MTYERKQNASAAIFIVYNNSIATLHFEKI